MTLLAVDDLVSRIRELELVEKDLAERKKKRAVVQKRYRLKHAEKIKEQKRQYYLKNKQQYADYSKRRREARKTDS